MKMLRNRRLHMVSLGCAKNRADSEKTLALLRRQGCEVTDDPAKAECILINSCGFIEDARRETVETILELAQYKKRNSRLKLAVMGCMVERFKDKISREMPEVDYLFSLSDVSMSEVYNSANSERALQPGSVSAYLKIAEGCGNSCGFCSIPLIRGPLKSRPMEEVAGEAQSLISAGIREICLVAQDTTRYGADLGIRGGIVKLLRRLKESGPAWLRLMYAYPTLVTDDLIELMARNESICPYLDIPFQHIDSGLLKAMGRQETEGDIVSLVERIRKVMPDGAIRTSFIVGFPGETEKSFRKLESFVKEARLDHVGLFIYSREEGTPAAEMPDDVPAEVKEERKARLMETQKSVSKKLNRRKIGKILPALVERYDAEERLLIGRLRTQAPEVDGEVILDRCEAAPGDIITVRITRAFEYDLVGAPA